MQNIKEDIKEDGANSEVNKYIRNKFIKINNNNVLDNYVNN